MIAEDDKKLYETEYNKQMLLATIDFIEALAFTIMAFTADATYLKMGLGFVAALMFYKSKKHYQLRKQAATFWVRVNLLFNQATAKAEEIKKQREAMAASDNEKGGE